MFQNISIESASIFSKSVPQKENNYDCEMFTLRYIYCMLILRDQFFDTSDFANNFQDNIYIDFQHRVNRAAMSKFRRNCYDFIKSLQHVVNILQITTKTLVELGNNHIFSGIDEFSQEEIEKLRPISLTLIEGAMLYYETKGQEKSLKTGKIKLVLPRKKR